MRNMYIIIFFVLLFSDIIVRNEMIIMDNNNIQESCTNIPIDTTVLRIAYQGFKSTTGISRAPNLEKITVIECQQEIHFDEVENCTKLKEVQLIRSPFANKCNLDKLSCRIFADLSGTGFNVEFIPQNVTTLELRKCGLTKIPNLQGFLKLVEVIFGGVWNNNKFNIVDVGNFPKNIQILDLSDCHLSICPDLRSFCSLVELSLGWNNQIQKIEANLMPKQLKILNTIYCELVEQPDLHSLESLIDLNFEGNQQIIKIEVKRLPKKLQKFDLNICSLIEQPDLHSLDSLVKLCLKHNEQIRNIQPDMLPKQLLKLDISRCGLVEQPNLHTFESLIDISFDYNKQIQIIHCDRLPPNIRVLDLSSTGISRLYQLYNCTKLKQLNANYCKIKDINQLQVLQLMPDLQIFKCYENDICQNVNIRDALALVLTQYIETVEIKLGQDIVNEIKLMQKNQNIKNPFTKMLDEMIDEQFYDEYKDEMAQLQIDIRAKLCETEYILRQKQQLVEERQKVDEQNNLIIRMLVGEE